MSDGSSVEEAYASPEAPIGRDAQGATDPVRLAAVLLLVVGALGVGASVAQTLILRWVPTWSGGVIAAAPFAFGIGLLRYGRRLAVPTLALLVLVEVPRFVGLGPLMEVGGTVVFAVPLIIVGVRLMPYVLLLLGRPPRWRILLATGIFVVLELFTTGTTVYQIIVLARNVTE